MSKWSGSDFAGPTENNWPQGVGKFKFPNGVVYEGNFDKGEFHGDGTLHYPNGVSQMCPLHLQIKFFYTKVRKMKLFY